MQNPRSRFLTILQSEAESRQKEYEQLKEQWQNEYDEKVDQLKGQWQKTYDEKIAGVKKKSHSLDGFASVASASSVSDFHFLLQYPPPFETISSSISFHSEKWLRPSSLIAATSVSTCLCICHLCSCRKNRGWSVGRIYIRVQTCNTQKCWNGMPFGTHVLQ